MLHEVNPIISSCTLSDEAALKAFWGSKGAVGTSPCWKCWATIFIRGESLVEHDATKILRDLRRGRGEFDLVSEEDRHIEADILTNCKAKVKPEEFQHLKLFYISLKIQDSGTLELRDFSFFLSHRFLQKNSMNSDIMKTQLFHYLNYDLKGH